MTTDVKTAGPDMQPRDAAGLMASFNIGAVPLVERDGRLVGVITDRDLVIRALAAGDANLGEVRLGDIGTTRGLTTISPDASLSDARELMRSARVKRLPVVKDDRLVGIVSLGDLAQASSSTREIGEVVRDIFESPATTRVDDTAQPATGTPERVMDSRAEQERSTPAR
jgi:CBS domain-containing protein